MNARPSRVRFALTLTTLFLAALPAAASAAGSEGSLTQKSGTEACVSESGTGGLCAGGVGLNVASSVTVSPDGKSAYVASQGSSAVAVFDRSTEGVLTQKGCISETGGDCEDGVGLSQPVSVTVSPDGKSAYVASFSSDAVAVLNRDTTTGALTQDPAPAGCISEGGTGGCASGVGLEGASSVTISPDGKHAYVASIFSDAVAVFDRNAATGALTQKSGTEACISEDNTVAGVTTCADGVGLDFAASVTVSPDGKSAYVASQNSGAVAVFDRDTTTGALSQDPAPAGCISEGGTGGCASGVGLSEPVSVTVSPDGKSAYVASSYSTSAVAVFDRNATTGALTQKSGLEACISETGSGGDCTDGVALDAAYSVTVSPDGKSAYVASLSSDAVAVFDRNATTGALTQKSGTEACISEDNTVDGVTTCADGVGLDTAASVTVSPDGKSAYVASQISGAVAVFDRTPDTTAPDTQIDSGPSGPTGDATPSFEFSSEPGATFECRVDTDDFSSCSSPETVAALTDGPHTFEVRATDSVGNTDPTPATTSFTVDTTPPDTQIDSGPSGPTGDATPSFEFSSEPGATFECRVDTDDFSSCSNPETVAALTDGPHTFEVRATDSVGNTDPTPATTSFTVDTTPPDTQIDSGPSGPTGDATPSFEFSSEPGATFECRVDTDDFSSCSNPETVAALTDGPHTFEVRATDSVGNTDPTPATTSFTVDTTPPDTTIDSGPSGIITTDEATFTFSGTPATDTAKIQCRIDSGPFADCTSPKTFTGLSDGPHTAEFRAEDAIGNQDPTPATRSFTVNPPVVDPPVDPPVGEAKIGKVKVKGPAKVKRRKKTTYKVRISNFGNAQANGVKLKVKGKGVKAKKTVGSIAAGKARTVKVKLKFKKPGRVKTSFKVTSGNAGGKTAKKKITVKK